MIDGVTLTPLKIIADERGQVMHMLRADAPHFEKFGEVYFSVIYPNVTKAWKLHSKLVTNVCVPIGRVKFVMHDLRENSATKGETQVVCLGDNNYQLLSIPVGVAYGWKNLILENAFVANCATEPNTPGEGQNLPIETIAYQW